MYALPLFTLLQKLLQGFCSCEWHVCKARMNGRGNGNKQAGRNQRELNLVF